MKLYELFSETGFHTSIVTSFGVDFDAYENVVLGRMRSAGCHNNLLLVDGNMLGLALETASTPPRHAGRRYTVTGAATTRLFHPKIILQLGRTKGRLVISSANMTAAGLAGNLEVAGIVETDGQPSGETSFFAAAWGFVSRFIDREISSTRQQVDWMLARTPWLATATTVPGPVTLKDGTTAMFLGSGELFGIATRFVEALQRNQIRRLVVISPYWDADLTALRFLATSLTARSTVILLDNGKHQFPSGALKNSSDIELRDYKPRDKHRFVHAKAYIAQTSEADHVLYGSANCTAAALGTHTYAGINEEACLYRRLPPGHAIEALELGEILSAASLDRSDIKDIEIPEPLPLQDIAARDPGRFECHFGTLLWWPATTTSADATIELALPDGTFGACQLLPLSSAHTGLRRFALPNPIDRPAFARLRYPNGALSAPAIVSLLDVLRDELRDARSKRIEAAIEELDGETEVGLWLLETLNAIEAAEALPDEVSSRTAIRSMAAASAQIPTSDQVQTLPYEHFIAGRRLRSDASVLSRSSFGGSDLSHVRGFLNRVLAIGSAHAASAPETDLRDAFDMGDETGAEESALEEGFDGGDDPLINAVAKKARVSALRRASRQHLVDAVADLHPLVRENATRGLRAVDLLRLRAMIIVLAAAGADGSSAPSTFQVLPPAGDTDAAWPRLIAKALNAYFGGKAPPIATLAIESHFDLVPDDILECWGTCLWAANVIVVAAEKFDEAPFLRKLFASLRTSIYAFTGLIAPEKMSVAAATTMAAMNARFAQRLGLDPAKIDAVHAVLLKTLGKPS